MALNWRSLRTVGSPGQRMSDQRIARRSNPIHPARHPKPVHRLVETKYGGPIRIRKSIEAEQLSRNLVAQVDACRSAYDPSTFST